MVQTAIAVSTERGRLDRSEGIVMSYPKSSEESGNLF